MVYQIQSHDGKFNYTRFGWLPVSSPEGRWPKNFLSEGAVRYEVMHMRIEDVEEYNPEILEVPDFATIQRHFHNQLMQYFPIQ